MDPPLSPIQPIKTRSTGSQTLKNGYYEPLVTSFRHDGFEYRQIARGGEVAIYEQRWIMPDGELSENVAYEMIKIQFYEAHTFPSGKTYARREGYPPSEM